MLILFYIHALTGGGAERVWTTIAGAFSREGHDVVLAVDSPTAAKLGFVAPSVRVIGLGSGHVESTLALAAFLRRERPDVTLSALGSANIKHVAAALLAGRLDRAVISYHGYMENEPRRLSRLSFRLTALLSRLAARTVVVSAALRHEVIERHHADPRRMVTILNPVEVPAMSVDDAELAARPPVVLAMSRLASAKNLTFLVRAFARVERPEARLLILGEGEDRPLIEGEIAGLGLGDRVEMPGYRKEPWPYYERSRVFASTSRIEAFGLNVVEALAAGLPVVSTLTGGPREILDVDGAAVLLDEGRARSVDCGGLGTLVVQDDELAYARALEAALDHPGRTAPRLARAAVFSVAEGVSAYAGLIGAVAAAARSPRRPA